MAETLEFRSKVDRWLLVVMVAAAATTVLTVVFALAIGIWQSGPAALFFIPLFIPMVAVGVGLPWWLLRSTRYTLTPEELRIVCGPFHWTVRLKDIRRVSRTSNPLSSPALSLRRLRIEYGNRRFVMISPDDEERFLRELEIRRPGVVDSSIRTGRRATPLDASIGRS
ncbi:MAG TPA: PH domain-containing protein [Gammaproteobacteria bacterium]